MVKTTLLTTRVKTTRWTTISTIFSTEEKQNKKTIWSKCLKKNIIFFFFFFTLNFKLKIFQFVPNKIVLWKNKNEMIFLLIYLICTWKDANSTILFLAQNFSKNCFLLVSCMRIFSKILCWEHKITEKKKFRDFLIFEKKNKKMFFFT